MLHSLCPLLLLLLFLTGGDAALANGSDNKGSDNTISCAYDTCCKAMVKLLTAFGELSENQDEQAVYISEKLGEQAARMLVIKDKQAKDQEEVKVNLREIKDKQEKDQEEVKANLREIHVKQDKVQKDLEELKANLNKALALISTQLEKQSTDLSSHDDRLKAHVAKENNTRECVAQHKPSDCSDIREGGSSVSGVYRVYPGTLEKRSEIDVYCDFSSVGQSWLVFQRRKDGSVDFDLTWVDYATGFGDLTGEFWLGNEKLSLLTMNRNYKLRVELEDFTGEKRYAEYSIFSVKPATDKYRLTVGGYTGNAGDSMIYQNGMQFTTKDADNDAWSGNCAVTYRGAWWHNACHYSNLNGLYLKGSHTTFADGVDWKHWLGYYYSLKTTEMKITAI